VNLAAGTQSVGGEPNVLQSIWKHRVLVGSIAAFFALVGIAVYLIRPITYAAEAGALLRDPRSTVDTRGNGSKSEADRYVADQVAIMKSNGVLARASGRMQTLKGITPLTVGELRRAMSIQTDLGSSWVTVRVKADDPVTARLAADSEIYAYRTTTKDHVEGQTRAALRKLDLSIVAVAHLMAGPSRTTAQQATALALIQQLRGRRNRIEVDGRLAGDGVALFSAAANGKRQGAPVFASTLIGLVLGGLIGFGVAYLIEAVKARGSTREGPVGPTPVAAPVREVQAPAAVEGDAASPIGGDPAAQPVAQRGRRWG
jgi:uncharacterized protein involved in exopolysaccharide biosynthesis